MKRFIQIIFVLMTVALVACGQQASTDLILEPQTLTGWTMKYAGAEGNNDINAKVVLSAANELQKALKKNPQGIYTWGKASKQQACAIEVLLTAYELDGSPKRLEAAAKATKALCTPQDDGGFLLTKDNEIWFADKNSNDEWVYSIDTQLQCLRVLDMMQEYSMDKINLLNEAIIFSPKMLLRFDRNMTFCGTIEPIKNVNIQFVNPYERTIVLPYLANIALNDEVSGKKTHISFTNMQDVSNMTFAMPGVFDITRTEMYTLDLQYFDGTPANVEVVLNTGEGKDHYWSLRDGDLLTDGAGKQREWRVAIQIAELYNQTTEEQAFAVKELLKELSAKYTHFNNWANTATTYYNTWYDKDAPTVVEQTPIVYPIQTWPNGAQIDHDGVVFQRNANENTKLRDDGSWDGKSDPGDIIYNVYLIAIQAWPGFDNVWKLPYYPDYEGYKWATSETEKYATKEAALNWLKTNYTEVQDSIVWTYDTDNAYGDLQQKAPWQSAYGQRFVMGALQAHQENELLLKAALAYQYPTKDGGLQSKYWKDGSVWYEEVPNNSHILNAHLTSLVGLREVNTVLHDERIASLYHQGVQSLQTRIADYDNGYWTCYDSNPQKDYLFQIDWLQGIKSPLIESILLIDPKDNTATKISLDGDGTEYPYFSGTDWLATETVDGRVGRSFQNGYLRIPEDTLNGANHHVYFTSAVPNREFAEFLDTPTYQLKITYKDVAAGKFAVKLRSKNIGDRMAFVPLKDGIIECVGDGAWKTRTIFVSPQDLESYMGYEYQKFHIEQLRQLAESEDNWYLAQYADKWDSYYQRWQDGKPVVIVEQFPMLHDITSQAAVENDDIMVPGFGLENSLDGDPNDDYTAAGENYELPQEFSLNFSKPTQIYALEFLFENIENYAVDYTLEGMRVDKTVWTKRIEDGKTQKQNIMVDASGVIDRIKIIVNKTHGQPRVLLRQITILEEQK